MDVIPVLVVCSLFLVVCAVALFAWGVGRGEPDHADRLSLLPLEDDLVDPGGESPPDQHSKRRNSQEGSRNGNDDG